VDSALGLLWLGSRDFAEGLEGRRGELVVTGGAAASEGTLRRIAAIWGRPVCRIGEAGAAAGAAVAAAVSLLPEAERDGCAARAAALVSGRGPSFEPEPGQVAAYHGEDGYLARLSRFLESQKSA
jgi:sugar (pentulose or hexulose) kinase